MMEQVKRFFECLIPVTICNLQCSYCYVIQRDNRKMKMPEMKYTPERIGMGLTKERLGGICYFSICGAGETLVPEETVEITREILNQGHFVNITTNGTLTSRFEEILKFPKEYLERLHIAFSLHYLELIRVNKLDQFFKNVRMMRKAGCSVLVQINLCDEYIPYWDEIKQRCILEVGAAPQVAASRKEQNINKRIELLTSLSEEEYRRIGEQYESPLFSFTMDNFGVKQTGFCYAGDWTGTLNLGTGMLTRCYGSKIQQDIFKDIDKPIKFQAVGCHCNALFCMNSSHFMSLGVITELNTPTYAFLRNREEADWYSDRMLSYLDSKLIESNEEYTFNQKCKTEWYNIVEHLLSLYYSVRHFGAKVLRGG